MRTSKSFVIVISLIMGFAIGLLVGIFLINPGMNLPDSAGTIGRVDQYRNIRITEADIELRNELLSDEDMLEAYRSYLAFEYSANLRMVEDLNSALQAGRSVPEFLSGNALTLERVERYAGYLENARLTILEAMGALNDLSGQSRVAVRSLLNNAGNAIAQSHSLSSPVFDFMLGVDSFMKKNPEGDFKQLANAHDQLLANLMMINIINKNLPVLEYLTEKSVLAEDVDLAQFDREMLRAKVLEDVGKLDIIIFDAEKLNTIFNDTERLAGFFSMENLASMLILNQEQLQTGFTISATALNAFGIFDAERLNVIVIGSEQMNLFNMEQLKSVY